MKKILLTSVMLLLCVGMMLTMAACGLKADPDPTLSTHWVTEPEEEPMCAGDTVATTEETEYPTEESVPETTELEGEEENELETIGETVEETFEEEVPEEEPELPVE